MNPAAESSAAHGYVSEANSRFDRAADVAGVAERRPRRQSQTETAPSPYPERARRHRPRRRARHFADDSGADAFPIARQCRTSHAHLERLRDILRNVTNIKRTLTFSTDLNIAGKRYVSIYFPHREAAFLGNPCSPVNNGTEAYPRHGCETQPRRKALGFAVVLLTSRPRAWPADARRRC
jgi:hypothetical protein